ncbi:hypothetical protein ACP70R_022192 [Stipagrostis hirtigluma subsp. patula]
MMSHRMVTATLPHVILLRATAEPRRQPFLHLHDKRSRCPGFIMDSLNGVARGAVRCIPVVRDGRHKETFIKDKPRATSEMINEIRAALKSMGHGDINASAYATAWAALVKNLDGGHVPQFPSSIDWIVQNQLPDGSWGDDTFFMIQDRIINTLACIVALKSWNIHDDTCQKGLSFIRENMWRLTEDDEDWMLIGFELTLPTLIEMAKDLGLDIPYDEPALQVIYAKRDLKLTKIPKDLLHAAPTTLLFSIEGMTSLDWNKIFKLQSSDGSFMSSPAPTAYALMHTGDKKCLEFLEGIINKFNGGVPNVYPVDTFERLWAADRLERLGISRYFKSEIKECLDYAYRDPLWQRNVSTGQPITHANTLSVPVLGPHPSLSD